MKIALLLRGFHFLERDRFGFPLDARKHLSSLLRNIIEPLRVTHEVKIFIATYPSPIQNDVVATIRPDGSLFLDSAKSTQASTFAAGLELIEKSGFVFDKLICTRFDLEYLKPIQKWNIWRDTHGIYFPWKEYEAYWRTEHRVGDAIHAVDASHVKFFKSVITQSGGGRELHGLYNALSESTSDLFFIEEGFFDSNSLYFNRECWNPLYRIANRPRLPMPQPWRPVGNLPFGQGFGVGRKIEMKFDKAIRKIISGCWRIFCNPGIDK